MNEIEYLEVSGKIMSKLSMQGYSFRPSGWGIKTTVLNEYLKMMEREGLITFDIYLGGIDYGSVRKV